MFVDVSPTSSDAWSVILSHRVGERGMRAVMSEGNDRPKVPKVTVMQSLMGALPKAVMAW